MSRAIRVNKAAMHFLLNSEEGPVGLEVKRRSATVVRFAQDYVGEIMHRLPQENLEGVKDSIRFEQDGTKSVIGIEDNGQIEQYLADKELREFAWLFPAAAWAFVRDD